MSDKKYTINDLVMKRSAFGFCHRWSDATPLGSGMTGILLFGGTAAERVVINRSDLWYSGEDAPVPDVSYCLEEMRKLEAEGKFQEANHLMYNELIRKDYKTSLADMRALGIVNIIFKDVGVFSDYRRVLHMDTAESEITYKLDGINYRRKAFMSRLEDMAVLEFTSEKAMSFDLDSGFFETNEGGREKPLKEADLAEAQYKKIGDCYVYSSKNLGKYFGIVCRTQTDGTVSVSDKGISVENAKKTLIFIKAFSEEENRIEAENKTAKIIAECDKGYDELFEENLPLYQEFYNTADISLYNGEVMHTNEQLLEDAREGEMSTELAEKLWRFGRYMFISGTATGGLPFPLYGIWPSGYERPFTHHVANENVQSIYWHTDVGGLSSLVIPLIDYYCANIEKFRENARQLFGCRGIYVGTYTTPRNAAIAWYVPVILHFCGVAGWLSQHFYKYYLFSGDEKLLNEKILPFMIEAAEFYEDFHYLDENGKIVLYPAVSPENSPVEYDDKAIAHTMVVTKNPTVEIAILKELLTNLIKLTENRPEFYEKIKIWKEMLSRVPEYLINEDGAVAEWIDTRVHDTYSHRHVSHIYPMFPGTEVQDTGDTELMAYFEKAVDLREMGSWCGWSMPHMSAIYSRLKRPQKAYQMLNALTKVCVLDNFFTLGHDYRDMGITGFDCGDEYRAPVQFDALLGTVNAIQEMLIFTSEKVLQILPACPKEFSKGNASLKFYSGTVELKWDLDNNKCQGVITAARDTEFILKLPFGLEDKKITLKKNEQFRF